MYGLRTIWRALPCIGTCVSLACGAAQFIPLGDLPGGADHSEAYAVSADGSVVVGVGTGSDGYEPAYWTPGVGWVGLGGATPHLSDAAARSCSADGGVAVGFSPGPDGLQAWRWTAVTGRVPLAVPGTLFESYAVECDSAGGTIVGNGTEFSGASRPFRWTTAAGLEFLNAPGQSAFANGVSGDGRVVVGQANATACRWGTTGIEYLYSPCGCVASATAASSDGGIVGGLTRDEFGRERAILWDAAGVPFLLPPRPNGKLASVVWALSGDGTRAVGGAGDASSNFDGAAVIWDATFGTQNLKAYLENTHGLNLTGWTLTTAKDISNDGLRIVGWGLNPGGEREGFLVQLPEPGTLMLIGLVVGARACRSRRRH